MRSTEDTASKGSLPLMGFSFPAISTGPLDSRMLPDADREEVMEYQERHDARGTILVVDDDASTLEMISSMLASEHYIVETARHGVEALRVLEQKIVNVVLLDIGIPVLSGWEVVRALREEGSHIPIVIMTASDDGERAAEEVGAFGYLTKPFEIAQLLDIVHGAGS